MTKEKKIPLEKIYREKDKDTICWSCRAPVKYESWIVQETPRSYGVVVVCTNPRCGAIRLMGPNPGEITVID